MSNKLVEWFMKEKREREELKRKVEVLESRLETLREDVGGMHRFSIYRESLFNEKRIGVLPLSDAILMLMDDMNMKFEYEPSRPGKFVLKETGSE